jgi:cbb3-type cytochrome oxidase subunit 3
MLNLLAQADTQLNLEPSELTELGGLTIEAIVKWAITFIVVVAALIFFFMLIIGGLKWILSGGDKAQTESARNQITAALIGLVIVFSAWAIATLVGRIFGVEILEFNIPSITTDTGGNT